MLRKLWRWWKKLKATKTDEGKYSVHGLEELTLLKWPYYQRESTDSVQSKYQCIFHKTRTNNSKLHVELYKRYWSTRTVLRKKIKEVSVPWF